MSKTFCQFNHSFCSMLFALVCMAFTHLVQANDDAAIEATFLNYSKIQFGDTIAAPYRIVQGKTWKEALTNKKPILAGMSNAASEVKFSLEQRKKLYAAWQKNPQEIWVIYFRQPEHLELKKEAGKYFIELVMSKSDADVAQEAAAEQAYNEGQKPLSKMIYTQAGFDAKPFTKDYADWQKRFIKDLQAFEANIQKDKEYGRKIVNDKNQDALKKTFGNSIDSGVTGLSLRLLLIESYYAPPGHEGTEVTPSGMVFSQMVLNRSAKPVGFGGAFSNENSMKEKTNIELWYMVFDDLADWTLSDFDDSILFGAFALTTNQEAVDESVAATAASAAATAAGKVEEAAILASKMDVKPAITKAELPPYKTIKRNSWPALVFTRGADSKVKLFGMSSEMDKILSNIYNKQLF